jgi:hypothetical protein
MFSRIKSIKLACTWTLMSYMSQNDGNNDDSMGYIAA